MKRTKENKEVLAYLKKTIDWARENPQVNDNEMIILYMLSQMTDLEWAILRERLMHTADVATKATTAWSNPIFHYTTYVAWGKKLKELLSFTT